MSLVPSKMVDVSHSDSTSFTLEQYLSGSNSVPVPIEAFGSKVSLSLIDKAINHMKSAGGGEISVPSPIGYTYNILPNFLVSVVKSSSGGFITRYQLYSRREPIGSEERPYGGNWEVGDVVYNYAMSESQSVCFGWICSESGTPGTWVQIGQVVSTGNSGGSGSSGGITGPVAEDGILTIDRVDGEWDIRVI